MRVSLDDAMHQLSSPGRHICVGYRPISLKVIWGLEDILLAQCHWLAAVCMNCGASAGADLDPLKVLSALSSGMPLSAGVDILSHLLCERLHRHRQGSVIRSLHKACSLSASVDRAEVLLLFPAMA